MSTPKSARALLKRKKRATVDCPIALDPDLAARVEMLREDLALTEGRVEVLEQGDADPDQVGQAKEKAAEKRAELDAILSEDPDLVVTFRLGAVSRHEMERLLNEYQPTLEQLKRERQKAKALGMGRQAGDLMFDPEKFPPRLVEASLLGVVVGDGDDETVLPVEAADFEEMWESDEWAPSELTFLFQTAYDLALRRRTVAAVGKGSAGTGSSGG